MPMLLSLSHSVFFLKPSGGGVSNNSLTRPNSIAARARHREVTEATMRGLAHGDRMLMARGASFSEIVLKRHSHPPCRQFAITQDRSKMINSPPTCKIAILGSLQELSVSLRPVRMNRQYWFGDHWRGMFVNRHGTYRVSSDFCRNLDWRFYEPVSVRRRSTRKAPIASSDCSAAFSFPMFPAKPCGIPIHTSSRASTPAAAARSTYRNESSNSTSSSPT